MTEKSGIAKSEAGPDDKIGSDAREPGPFASGDHKREIDEMLG